LVDEHLFRPPPYDEVTSYIPGVTYLSGRNIAVWYDRLEENRDGVTVLFSHSTSDDLSKAHPYLRSLKHCLQCDVLAYSYGGYYANGAKAALHRPSEESVCKDARAVYRHAVQDLKINPSRIVLMGYSIGTGVTCYLATHTPTPVLAVVLVAAFGSIMSAKFGAAVTAAVKTMDEADPFPNADRITQIRSPVLLVHGEKDEICNVTSVVRALYNTRKSSKLPVEMALYKEGTHSDIMQHVTNHPEPVAAFLARVRGRGRGSPGETWAVPAAVPAAVSAVATTAAAIGKTVLLKKAQTMYEKHYYNRHGMSYVDTTAGASECNQYYPRVTEPEHDRMLMIDRAHLQKQYVHGHMKDSATVLVLLLEEFFYFLVNMAVLKVSTRYMPREVWDLLEQIVPEGMMEASLRYWGKEFSLPTVMAYYTSYLQKLALPAPQSMLLRLEKYMHAVVDSLERKDDVDRMRLVYNLVNGAENELLDEAAWPDTKLVEVYHKFLEDYMATKSALTYGRLLCYMFLAAKYRPRVVAERFYYEPRLHQKGSFLAKVKRMDIVHAPTHELVGLAARLHTERDSDPGVPESPMWKRWENNRGDSVTNDVRWFMRLLDANMVHSYKTRQQMIGWANRVSAEADMPQYAKEVKEYFRGLPRVSTIGENMFVDGEAKKRRDEAVVQPASSALPGSRQLYEFLVR
jgi:dienelactone hydrolase